MPEPKRQRTTDTDTMGMIITRDAHTQTVDVVQDSYGSGASSPDSTSCDTRARDGEQPVGEQDDEEDDEYDYKYRPGFSGINLCIVCKIDMGDINGRQYCGKWHCNDECWDEGNGFKGFKLRVRAR